LGIHRSLLGKDAFDLICNLLSAFTQLINLLTDGGDARAKLHPWVQMHGAHRLQA
jgi:hypothetical protein